MFSVDNRIENSSFHLKDWPLSSIFLKNDQSFPWFILVPRRVEVQEIFQLDRQDRQQLIEEIHLLSQIIQDYFKPTKLNIGALGNMVPQLHIHIVARRQDDALWPHGIWQDKHQTSPYDESHLKELIPTMIKLIDKGIENFRN